MKTRFLTTVILLLIVCATLCGCGTWGAPLGKVEIPNQTNSPTVRIYISGAVERDGYFEAVVGEDYTEVLRRAGLLNESILPTLSSSYVDGSVTVIYVDYYDGETVHESTNVNGLTIAAHIDIDDLSIEVVNKLADYIQTHGKISNRQQLAQALGSDYTANYYKLFIAEYDYEEAD